MSRFSISDTPLAGVKVVQREHLDDERGFLARLFCADELSAAGWQKPILQINHTLTQQCGTVRGLHFQRRPSADMKLVSCIRGEVWDVVVDLVAGSSTYLRWHAEILSAENRRALLIPEGYAHGFQTLTDDCELIYLHTAVHAPHAEAGVNPADPRLAINWPLPISLISERDANLPMLDSDFKGPLL
jgi:dTDP-4-dehydrorhamnose 3,5-epimerase